MHVTEVSAISDSAVAGAGEVLRLLRDGVPRTRVEIGDATGLRRSAVAHRVTALLDSGLIKPIGDDQPTGGRPASRVGFNPEARVALAAELGTSDALLMVTDLEGRVLGELRRPMDIALGPIEVLDWVHRSGMDLLKEAGRSTRELVGVGVGLPGPVDHETGRPSEPVVMHGWNRFDVRGHLEQAFGKTVAVDNDVNLMAVGEAFTTWPDARNLVFVKISSVIGAGLISNGSLHRGAQGAAGDLGHLQVTNAEHVLCRCGNTGCLEAVAGGAAVLAELRAAGLAIDDLEDIPMLARNGALAAVQALRDAGRRIGEALANVVTLLNPDVVVLGGPFVDADLHLLAGVREVVYGRSLPLVTQRLQIVPSQYGERAGAIGAAVMVIEQALHPNEIDRELSKT